MYPSGPLPQGSILGPLLFNLYINDLGDDLKWSILKLFADDTLDYVSGKIINEIVSKINNDLKDLYNKICQYKLKLNVTKTKVMIITNLTNINDISVKINGIELEIVDKIKYLGVIIDNQLNFKPNSEYVCKKLGRKVGVLARLRNDLNFKQKMLIYKTIVEPHLTYCSTILFQAQTGDIDALQLLQNKCMRSILRENRYASIDTMLNTLEIMNVRQIIIYNTLIFIYKIVKGETPSYLTNKITYKRDNPRKNTLRNRNQIEKTNAKTMASRKSIFYRGIELFNNLPEYLKNKTSVNLFKNKIKKYVILQFK